jgi:hypothetical protein
VAPPHAVGTALTLQTSLGFLLTLATIQLVPLIQLAAGWRWAFPILALGPAAGIACIARLRRGRDKVPPIRVSLPPAWPASRRVPARVRGLALGPSVRVPVVQIGHVRVVMDERHVPMGVGVRLAWWIGSLVFVLMVFVVNVQMVVLD